MTSRFDLDGRVIVVTGGLGQLGAAYVQALAEHGARVAIIDVAIDLTRIGTLADHERVMICRADVTSRLEIEKARDQIVGHFGTPFGLVNNAAIDSPPSAPAEENGPFEDFPEIVFDKVMAANVKGPFLASQVFGGAMAQAGRGSIVNIASIFGMVSPDQAVYAYRRTAGQDYYKPPAYSVSKSALYNLTRYCAAYWGKSQVRVNSLTLAGVFADQDPAFLKSYLGKVPLGRMAEPDDYVGGVIFLMSDASRYMTGANLVLDGGYLAL